jgi:hypothetical protein
LLLNQKNISSSCRVEDFKFFGFRSVMFRNPFLRDLY